MEIGLDIGGVRGSLPQAGEAVTLSQSIEDPLVTRLRRGEAAAVADAYHAHHGAVRTFARRLVGDDHVAEDLLHDTFVALPKAVRRFRGDSSLRTFLIAVAANLAKRHVRSARRRRRAMSRYSEERREDVESPEENARRRQLAAALARALDSLPIDQRLAFVLCEVEQRTSIEAAEILRVPEGTVRTRLFHARRKLRDRLTREGVR